MFKSFIEKLRSNQNFKKLLNIFLVISFALYIFSIPSFSGRAKLNLISYGLMAISAVLVFLTYLLYEHFIFDKRLIILLLFVFESLIGTLLHSHDYRHWLSIVLLYLSFLIFYYGFCLIKDKKKIILVIAFALLSFGLYFAFNYRTSVFHLNFNEPLGNDFDNVNTIGTYFSIGSTLFLYLALTAKKKIEWFYILPCVLLLGLGMFTGSRHFIITTGVTFIACFLIVIKKHKWIALLGIIIVIGLFFAIIQLPSLATIKERINRGITTLFGIGDAKTDTSAIQRTIWPQYGFTLGTRVLLFGYGASGFTIFSGIGTYSHNTYSEIICNFGICGAFIFYSAFLYPFILSIRSRKRENDIVLILVIFYLIKGFFGVYISSKDAYVILAFLFYSTKDIHLLEYVGFNVKTQREVVCHYSEIDV